MLKSKDRCPNCGVRVSPFAAGCAVCGADLDIHRFDRPTVMERVRRAMPSTYGLPTWVYFLVGGFVAYFVITAYTG